MPAPRIAVLGSFVADLAFRTPRAPRWGETVLGSAFQLGPGGKGSNQAIAAARLGAQVSFISKLGRDSFGELARRALAAEGVDTRFVVESPDLATGAASILIDQATGENAIVVTPGASFLVTPEEVATAQPAIATAHVFLAQLETQVPAVLAGLRTARAAGVTTVLNPAPAAALPPEIYPLCDYLLPNEIEAASLTGLPVSTPAEAGIAARALETRGVGCVIVTLGANGALVCRQGRETHAPAFDAGPVVETTGAGDAFAGAFVVALAEGRDPVAAAQFACTAAGLSVTRAGTAPAMPHRGEVEAARPREIS